MESDKKLPNENEVQIAEATCGRMDEDDEDTTLGNTTLGSNEIASTNAIFGNTTCDVADFDHRRIAKNVSKGNSINDGTEATSSTTTASSSSATTTCIDTSDSKKEYHPAEAILQLASFSSIEEEQISITGNITAATESTKEDGIHYAIAKVSSMQNKSGSGPEYKDQVRSASILVSSISEDEKQQEEEQQDEDPFTDSVIQKPSHKRSQIRHVLGMPSHPMPAVNFSNSAVAFSLTEDEDALSSVPMIRSPATHRIAITTAPPESDLPCVVARLIPGAAEEQDSNHHHQQQQQPETSQEDLEKMMAEIKKEERRFWTIVLISAIALNSLLISAVIVAAFCASGACGKSSSSDLPIDTATTAPAIVMPIPTVRPTFAPQTTLVPTAPPKGSKGNPGVSKAPSIQPPPVVTLPPAFVIPQPETPSAAPTIIYLQTEDPTSSSSPSFKGQTARPTSYPTLTVLTSPPSSLVVPGPMSPPTTAPIATGNTTEEPTFSPTSAGQTIQPTFFSTSTGTQTGAPTLSPLISGQVVIRLFPTPSNWTESIRDDYLLACDRFWEENILFYNLTVKLISASFYQPRSRRRLSSVEVSHGLETTVLVQGIPLDRGTQNLQYLLPTSVNQNSTGFIAAIQDQEDPSSKLFYEHVTKVDAYEPDKIPPLPSSPPTSTPTLDDDSSDGVPIIALVGIAVALEALFCAALYFYYRRWKSRRLVMQQRALSKQPRFREPSSSERSEANESTSTNSQNPDSSRLISI